MKIEVLWRCTEPGCQHTVVWHHELEEPLSTLDMPIKTRLLWLRDEDGEHLFCREHYDAWNQRYETRYGHKVQWKADIFYDHADKAIEPTSLRMDGSGIACEVDTFFAGPNFGDPWTKK